MTIFTLSVSSFPISLHSTVFWTLPNLPETQKRIHHSPLKFIKRYLVCEVKFLSLMFHLQIKLPVLCPIMDLHKPFIKKSHLLQVVNVLPNNFCTCILPNELKGKLNLEIISKAHRIWSWGYVFLQFCPSSFHDRKTGKLSDIHKQTGKNNNSFY